MATRRCATLFGVTLRTVTVIGLGLIGGSVLRAASRAGRACRGYDTDPAARDAARAAGPWRIDDSPAAAADGADLVVLAVPPAALPATLAQLAGHPGLVTDVASVKVPALAAARRVDVRFVGGHPMAGRELPGFAASDPTLFADRPWVLCLDEQPPAPDAPAAPGPPDPPGAPSEPGRPTRPGQPDGLRQPNRPGRPDGLGDWLAVAEFALALGARVVPAVAAEHDDAVARISHLPHLIANALATQAGGPLPATLAAGSFADGTRVAASEPGLWADICTANAPAVREALDRLIADLAIARAALDVPPHGLRAWFGLGHAVRAGWPPAAGPAERVPADPAALLALGRAGGWLTARTADGLLGARPASR